MSLSGTLGGADLWLIVGLAAACPEERFSLAAPKLSFFDKLLREFRVRRRGPLLAGADTPGELKPSSQAPGGSTPSW